MCGICYEFMRYALMVFHLFAWRGICFAKTPIKMRFRDLVVGHNFDIFSSILLWKHTTALAVNFRILCALLVGFSQFI